MATISGDIMALNKLDPMIHAVGADVIARQGRKVLGTGVVGEDQSFSFEIDDDVRGELEITLALHNAAPSLVTTEGGDLHVTVIYSNVNNYIA